MSDGAILGAPLAQRLTQRLGDLLARADHGETLLLADDGIAGLEDGAPGVPAAVLVAVTDRAEPGVILTQRPQSMRRHPGQVAFPGGRIDPGDSGPIDAALREAYEEIGLVRGHVSIIGEAPGYRTGTGFHITPVIGIIPPDLPLFANQAEVDAIFEVPAAFLADPANRQTQVAVWQGRERRYIEMNWQGFRIWGATAAMIVNLARVIA